MGKSCVVMRFGKYGTFQSKLSTYTSESPFFVAIICLNTFIGSYVSRGTSLSWQLCFILLQVLSLTCGLCIAIKLHAEKTLKKYTYITFLEFEYRSFSLGFLPYFSVYMQQLLFDFFSVWCGF